MSGLCTVSFCPAKKDVDWHRCWVCGALEIEHHHVKSRGMGGSKKRRDDPLNVVALCHKHHELVTLHECSDDILDFPGRGKVYVYFDLHGNTLIERALSTKEESDETVVDAADSGDASDDSGADAPGNRGSAVRLEEESDGLQDSASDPKVDSETSVPRGSDRRDSGGPVVGDRDSVPLTHEEESDGQVANTNAERGGVATRSQSSNPLGRPLTHEQRVAIAQAIKHTKQQHSFLAGDTANLWEEELGEDFWNRYANEFGYTYPSLRNVMRVCKAIPPDQRHDEMSFAAHEALKNCDRETREAWLERAFEEEWPVKRLREELVTEGLLTAKKKTRKWSLEELRGRVSDAQHGEMTCCEFDGAETDHFLDWLEAQA